MLIEVSKKRSQQFATFKVGEGFGLKSSRIARLKLKLVKDLLYDYQGYSTEIGKKEKKELR